MPIYCGASISIVQFENSHLWDAPDHFGHNTDIDIDLIYAGLECLCHNTYIDIDLIFPSQWDVLETYQSQHYGAPQRAIVCLVWRWFTLLHLQADLKSRLTPVYASE